MRSYEEIDLAAGLVQQYADRKREALDAETLSIKGIESYHIDGVVNSYANRVWQWKAAHYLAEALRELATYQNIDKVLEQGYNYLRELQVYLHESDGAQRFWFDTEIHVAQMMWLQGYDWPTYSGLFHSSRLY
jgi:hypothetical protein